MIENEMDQRICSALFYISIVRQVLTNFQPGYGQATAGWSEAIISKGSRILKDNRHRHF
jgi:hypothetical protein